MEARKLTQKEIDKLFELCEFHNVHYYDVQIELVDHLASSIEALWETNSQLSFEEAAFQVGEQFNIEPCIYSSGNSILPLMFGKKFSGENGFEIITESKEKELRRKYDRLQLKYIAEFFKLPKIILTLAITSILFLAFKLSGNAIAVSYTIQGFYILSVALYLIFISPKKNHLNIVADKSFLLYEHFRKIRRGAVGAGVGSYNIVVFLGKFNHLKITKPLSNYLDLNLLTAFSITFFGILLIAIFVYTPQRIKADFIREYPQFVKV
jgi:hypothetical protein